MPAAAEPEPDHSPPPASSAPAPDDGPPGPRDPFAAFRFANYRCYLTGRTISVLGEQMLAVAVAWELYERTRSATALGAVGLVQAVPIFIMALPAGALADRLNRRNIALVCQALTSLCSFALALLSARREMVPNWPVLAALNGALESAAHAMGGTNHDFSDPAIPLMYAILLVVAVVKTFAMPARAAMVPMLVPIRAFPNAVTWNTSAFQISSMVGPAAGGFLLAAFDFSTVYAIDGVCTLLFFVMLLPIRIEQDPRKAIALTPAALAAGAKFVWKNKVLLGAVTLDMMAVLVGGATALLPIFADDLGVGPVGLGCLRSAPGLGALLIGLAMAFLPPIRNAGKTLLWVVVGFGAATIVFGLSGNYWLSLAMLFLTGAFDNVSVVIRHTLVQLLPPDDLRGRVSAINTVFIGTSNHLGELESGVAAELFGHVPAVVGGGIGTIVVVALATRVFPALTGFGALDSARRAPPAKPEGD